MLRVFFFILFVAAVVLFFGLAQLLLLRQLNRVWWQKKWVRRSAYGLPVAGVLGIVALGLAEYSQVDWLSAVSAPVAVVALVLELCLMLSLPVSGAFHLVEKLLDRWGRSQHRQTDDLPDPRRRLVLRSAAALVPAATVAAGLGGVGHAYARADVTRKIFEYEHLPMELDGLRILHLSDLHMRHYVTLDDLTDVLIDADAHRPDLILLTGDVADDLNLLPDALALVAQVKPGLGCFATLGNHEYFRGIDEVLRIYSEGEVRLLVNETVRVKLGDAAFYLGGLDDPRSMHGDHSAFYHNSLNATLQPLEDNIFTVLMTHRPGAFPPAAERDVDLMLAGHTHGGQVGFAGRSVLESSLPERYLWGKYQLGQSQLYTSCGVGHWFPFRLGCPTEAPIIELKSI